MSGIRRLFPLMRQEGQVRQRQAQTAQDILDNSLGNKVLRLQPRQGLQVPMN